MGGRGTVNVVSSGDEGIEYMIGEGKFADRTKYPFPTLVITDLNMDQGDGFDVLEFMQNNPAWSVVPRVVFSSSDDDDDVRTAFLLGASVYHLKPAQSTDLEKSFGTYWNIGANRRFLRWTKRDDSNQRRASVAGVPAIRR